MDQTLACVYGRQSPMRFLAIEGKGVSDILKDWRRGSWIYSLFEVDMDGGWSGWSIDVLWDFARKESPRWPFTQFKLVKRFYIPDISRSSWFSFTPWKQMAGDWKCSLEKEDFLINQHFGWFPFWFFGDVVMAVNLKPLKPSLLLGSATSSWEDVQVEHGNNSIGLRAWKTSPKHTGFY